MIDEEDDSKMLREPTQQSPTVCLISLGCPKNQVDSEILSAGLLEEGFSFVADPAQAEVIILNTCSFIEDAVQESLEILEDLAVYRREGACRCLTVAGCLVERYGEDLHQRLSDVDLFLGTEAVEDAGRVLARHLRGEGGQTFIKGPLVERPGRCRPLYEKRQALAPWAYVKIAEGCSNACTYCTLPQIRGPLRSRRPEEIVREAAHLALQGVQEINLIAQDVTAYGRDREGVRSGELAALLRQLEQVRGLAWIRLLYCHPAHLDEETIARIAGSQKLCPYLDLPVQHVSRSILKAMGRPYDEQRLRSLIAHIRSLCPDVALRTTVMVGFPGETERDVEQLLSFVKEIRFHHLGVFCYSPEEETAAFVMEDSVSESEKWERRDAVMAVQAEISERILQGFVGTRQEVLIEGPHEEAPDRLRARTRYQAPEVDGCVILHGSPPHGPGRAMARVIRGSTYDLEAEILAEAPPA
jgi:ribosomal protein S12 methylthiotransferase